MSSVAAGTYSINDKKIISQALRITQVYMKNIARDICEIK